MRASGWVTSGEHDLVDGQFSSYVQIKNSLTRAICGGDRRRVLTIDVNLDFPGSPDIEVASVVQVLIVDLTISVNDVGGTRVQLNPRWTAS
jgi:hypothetical protein